MSLIHIHLSLENNVFVLLYSWQVEVEHLNGKLECHLLNRYIATDLKLLG